MTFEGGEDFIENSAYIPDTFLNKEGVGIETDDDTFDVRSARIFEPRTFEQSITAWWQNTFEVTFLMILYVLAWFFPHFISLTVVLTSSNMVLPINMVNVSRINWGRVFNAINCVIIGCAIYYKLSVETKYEFDDNEKADDYYDWYKSMGFYFDNSEKPNYDKTNMKYHFKIFQKDSLSFEYGAMAISLLAFSQYQSMQNSINKLSRKKFRQEVILLQNYELSKLYQVTETKKKDEDSSTNVEISPTEKEQKKLDELMKRQYVRQMDDLSRQFPKNFLDCRWFHLKCEKFFVATMICQLIQSMGYNGLFDIPSLLLILGVFGFYSFRKTNPHGFQIYIFLAIYYIGFAILIKWLYITFIEITLVDKYFKKNHNSLAITILQALFGKRLSSIGTINGKQSDTKKLEGFLYQLSIIGTFYFSQIYQSAKWCRIRDHTMILTDQVSFWARLKFYSLYKDKIATKDQRVEKILEQSRQSVSGSQSLLAKQTDRIAKKMKALNQNLVSKLPSDMNKYYPTICIWILRIGLGFQSYMYHSSLGLFHLSFVLFTFLWNTRFSLMVCIHIMLPIYFIEFITIYAMKIEAVNQNSLFQVTKQLFLGKLKFPILEQALYFLNLAFMISCVICLKLCFMSQDVGYIDSSRDAMVELIIRKVCEKDTSIIWKVLFRFARYSHVIGLALLFYVSLKDLDNMRSLAFLMFFTFYSAFEVLYRKTKWILSFYLCYLIFNNYYYSLILPSLLEKGLLTNLEKHLLKWYNLVSQEPYEEQIWKPDSSIYFRHHPDYFNWSVLIMMVILDIINKIFLDTKLAQEMDQQSEKILMDRYPEVMKFVVRAKKILSSYLTLIVCGIIVYYISKSDTTIINWIYFSLNMLLLCYLSNNDGKQSTLKKSFRISNLILYYSVVLLIGQIIFTWIFGMTKKVDIDGSNDQKLFKAYPIIYENLPLIGLRYYEPPNQKVTKQQHLEFLGHQCTSYIMYMLIGLYFSSKFNAKLEAVNALEKINEDDFQRIFEFKTDIEYAAETKENQDPEPSKKTEKPSQKQKKQSMKDSMAQTNQNFKAGTYSNFILEKIKDKSSEITRNDFEMFYIMFQYDPGFQAYKYLKWWPVLDLLATYGHLLTNLIIVIISTSYVINIYTMLNLCLICLLYMRGTSQITKKAIQYHKQCGLQSQIDCKMASLVSKKYQRAAHYSFGKIRKTVWKCQLFLLVIVCILGYPTSLLATEREKYSKKPHKGPEDKLDKLDRLIFWLWYAGIWKDPRPDVMWSFYGVVICISICLLIERMLITWLFTRNGCTYNRFQKYIEMEIRLENFFNSQPPKYHPERYRNHYYDQDFNELLMRFKETDIDIKDREKIQKKHGILEIRNFIPYKVALRIKESITFSILLDGRSQDIKIDYDTERLLNKWDRYCYNIKNKKNRDITIEQFVIEQKQLDSRILDYEEYDILKQHKISLLQRQIEDAISRKYRISFAKGVRIFYEQCILYTLMLCMLLKSNIYSIVYLLYVVRYMLAETKLNLLNRLVRAIGFVMLVQYTLFITNMTAHLSPIQLPVQFDKYPITEANPQDINGPYSIPIFYKYDTFKDLKFAYLVGMPVNQDQLSFLTLDFFILFLVSNYVFLYQSPVLDASVKKIFFCFPGDFDSNEKWKRVNYGQKKQEYVIQKLLENEEKEDQDQQDSQPVLLSKHEEEAMHEDNVQQQIRWMRNPYLPSDLAFKEKNYNKQDIELAKHQFDFACSYGGFINPITQDNQDISNHNDYIYEPGEEVIPQRYQSCTNDLDKDLNYSLINYCELKFNEIWSSENVRARKWELKQNNFYFRLVKQGSVLVYLSSHIFVLFVILMMSAIRQSLIGFIYVLFIIWSFFRTRCYAGDVLTQRDQNQTKNFLILKNEQKQLKNEKKKIAQQLQAMEEAGIDTQSDRLKELKLTNQSQECDIRNEALEKQVRNFKKKVKIGNVKDQAKQQWGMINVFGTYLLLFCSLDFSASILYQLSIFGQNSLLKGLGLKKVWSQPKVEDKSLKFTYESMVRATSDSGDFIIFHFNGVNFFTLAITCFMMVLVIFQVEIYRSNGYLKFVTQSNGSLDLLMELASLKKQSLAFTKNNVKIKKILSIQSKRKLIIQTLEMVQRKIKRWRIFQRTTIDREKLKKEEEKKQQNRAEQLQKGSFKGESTFERLKNTELQKQNSKLQKQLSLKEQQAKMKQDDAAEDFQDMLKKQKSRVSKAEAEQIYEKIAQEFVHSKISKLNRCSRCYLCLNSCFVKNIMLKNDEQLLREIVKGHAAGEVETPCELERIMKIEAKHIVRKQYDKKEEQDKLYLILKKLQQGGFKKSIMSMTQIDKKIKIYNLENTWAYTRFSSMIFKYIELAFYIFITNTDNFVYFFMMYSMYQNAGLMSIVYPISIFGYALIEENRPKKQYWDFIRVYSIFILMIKLVANLSWLDDYLDSETFKYWHGILRIGLQNRQDTLSIIIYMLPETLIITTLMLNEIMMRLNGVFEHHEGHYETVFDALERWKAKGDLEKQQEALIQNANMDMGKYFKSYEEQKQILQEVKEEEERQRLLNNQNDGDFDEDSEELEEKLSEEDQINELIKEYSIRIQESANKFDLDVNQSGQEARNSKLDQMIENKLFIKALETDSVYFEEGKKEVISSDFDQVDHKLIRKEMLTEQIKETVSDGWFEEDMDEKIEVKISEKDRKDPGIFERSDYLRSIFPSMQIQKPGYDYYGFTTMILGILAMFVFYGFNKINTSQKDILKDAGQSSDLFTTDTSLALFANMMLIILERYINRTNVMYQDEQSLTKSAGKNLIGKLDDAAGFASRRTMTSSMTMHQQTLKTMQTSDIDAQMGGEQGQLLDQLYQNAEDQEQDNIETHSIKITHQQKLKFILHWVLIISVHLMIFWFIPIRGNMKLYNLPYCDPTNEVKFPYGCKNFRASRFLVIFYFLFCCYFAFSALQLRYGLPIWKKASSIVQYMDYDSWSGQFGYIGAQVYMMIPFGAELRCLFDFVLTKTSLDIFQFWQLFSYQVEMYLAHFGNQSYVVKVMGMNQTFADYILGYIFITVILLLIIGPIYFFSSFSNFSILNPVLSSQITVELTVNKTLSIKDIEDRMLDFNELSPNFNQTLFSDTSLFVDSASNKTLYEKKNLISSIPFKIFQTDHPYMKQLEEKDIEAHSFSNWTETQFFKPEQVQELVCTEYPDKKWKINSLNKAQMKKDIENTIEKNSGYKIQLGISGSFMRQGPPQNEKATNYQARELKLDFLDDCITGQQLVEFSKLDCDNPNSKGYTEGVLIPISQAYNPFLILGRNPEAVPIVRKIIETEQVDRKQMEKTLRNGTVKQLKPWMNKEVLVNETAFEAAQKYDVLLEFRCPDRWLVRMSTSPTVYRDWEINQDLRQVDPKTCASLGKNVTYDKYLDEQGELYGTLDSDGNFKKSKNYNPKYKNHAKWDRLQFTLFSMFVSSSIFASYSVGAFYSVFLYGLGPKIRTAFIFGTWKGILYEITDARIMMRIFEACYMYRYEQNLYAEEESYRMIQEIIRSPGLLKLLTGTSLKGTLDPSLDNLKKDVAQKLKRLELLEQKGFEVTQIREKILREQDESIDAAVHQANKKAD